MIKFINDDILKKKVIKVMTYIYRLIEQYDVNVGMYGNDKNFGKCLIITGKNNDYYRHIRKRIVCK